MPLTHGAVLVVGTGTGLSHARGHGAIPRLCCEVIQRVRGARSLRFGWTSSRAHSVARVWVGNDDDDSTYLCEHVFTVALKEAGRDFI